jgi:hypothetical protein
MTCSQAVLRGQAVKYPSRAWVELRIGEWLGPAKEGFKGNQYSGSSPGDEAKIHNRHKYEFRFMTRALAF